MVFEIGGLLPPFLISLYHLPAVGAPGGAERLISAIP